MQFCFVTFEGGWGVDLNANINIEITDGIRWNGDTRYLRADFAVTLKIHMNHCMVYNYWRDVTKMIHVMEMAGRCKYTTPTICTT